MSFILTFMFREKMVFVIFCRGEVYTCKIWVEISNFVLDKIVE